MNVVDRGLVLNIVGIMERRGREKLCVFWLFEFKGKYGTVFYRVVVMNCIR